MPQGGLKLVEEGFFATQLQSKPDENSGFIK
jgi:hypothetical protein